MSADAFGAGGSDAQQTLQSFWPRVMEEIRNLTVVRYIHKQFYRMSNIHTDELFFMLCSELYVYPLISEGFPCAGVASGSNQEDHEAG